MHRPEYGVVKVCRIAFFKTETRKATVKIYFPRPKYSFTTAGGFRSYLYFLRRSRKFKVSTAGVVVCSLLSGNYAGSISLATFHSRDQLVKINFISG